MPIKPVGPAFGHSRGMSAPVIERHPVHAEWTPGEALLRRFDVPGPRYTSYPTADRFVDAFGSAEYRQALAQRATAGAAGTGMVGGRAPLSVYVHVPFCESVCYYCACNKVITRQHGKAQPYLDALERELALQTEVLGRGQTLTQLHLGGGTPTFLSDAELERLMHTLRAAFHFAAGAEVSIEVDPRTVSPQRLEHLAALGFNRLSFGVQDFDAEVQQAVHRVQPFDQVARLIESARALHFESINVDLIHGLPRQTPASFERTIARLAPLRPDRIALYGYAHLPQRFKPQRRIEPADLPSPAQRLQMLAGAIRGLTQQGYQYIGMDHFALPGDALAVARRQGRLHRNFQGYSTQPDNDLIALGVSAIGKLGATYSQNAKTLPEYYDLLERGELPVVRGIALTRDDLVRRAIIMALMCQGRLDFESIALAHLIDFRVMFAHELAQMQALAEQGLVEIEADGLQLTREGWFFVRAVAMVFDRGLQSDQARALYSRVL
jgi:oxygen-independent coproporphyrinogen III oxidase